MMAALPPLLELLARSACIQWQAADDQPLAWISRSPLTVFNQVEVLS
jgi:hypothetical protein